MADKKRILVVDDEASVRSLLCETLRRCDFAVEQADCAQAMRQKLALEEAVDLVVLDVRLPDGSGFDLLRELREKGDLPVVLLTGLDTPVHRINGLDYGADDYISKPF